MLECVCLNIVIKIDTTSLPVVRSTAFMTFTSLGFVDVSLSLNSADGVVNVTAPMSVFVIPAPLSLLPFLLTVIIALWLKNVLVALFLGDYRELEAVLL